MNNNRRKISWSDFPPELLSEISIRLETRSDILHFRSVCNSWRKSAPISLLTGKTTILSPILPHNFSISHNFHKFKFPPVHLADRPLVLVASTVFLVRSISNPNLTPLLFTVEEFNPGRLYLHRPLCRSVYHPLPVNFKENLDLSGCRVSEISRMYNLSFAPQFDADSDDVCRMKMRKSHFFRKVILYVDSDRCEGKSIPEINHCSLVLLYDDGAGGSLTKIKLENGEMSSLCSQNVKKFDDFVNFKGRIYVVDRKGRLYREKDGVLGTYLAVNEAIGEGLGTDRKKQLVESCGELYLIYRCPRYAGVAFKVYKLNEKERKWDQLKGIGDDRIVVATSDGCFFIPSEDIPSWRGNILVFCRFVFSAYNSPYQADLEIFKSPEGTTLDIAVFDFETGECKPIESYPGYSKVFFSRPWLATDTCCSKRGSKKRGEAQKDYFPNKCPESRSNNEASYPIGSAEDVGALGLATKMQCSTTTVSGSATSATESFGSGYSMTKFQGVDVSSDLLPTLEKIWAKHGNILEGHKVRSNDLVAWALRSIAKMVILLQNTAYRSLNDSQADYLSSTLVDLQLMHLNISWLVPLVVKALKMHKGMGNREKLEDMLKEIEKVTTQVADMKMKFLAEVGGLEKMLDEQRKSVCASLSVLDCLDKCTLKLNIM